MLSEVQLVMIAGVSVQIATEWTSPLNIAMAQGQINTCLRVSAFLSQVLEESGCFRYVKEIWGPTPAQLRYEGRADLGNVQSGDGEKFLGRGLIQITGRANYRACGHYLNVDLESNPELLEQPLYAVLSAVWYWQSHNINALADVGDIVGVTRLVNGGTNGLDVREKYYAAAKTQLFC